MKRFLGILMVLLLSPLAYLYAEKNLKDVQAQWGDYQASVASNEARLAASIYDSQSDTSQGDNADIIESQNSIEETSENREEAIIDSIENEGSDDTAVNTEPIDNVTNNSPDISTTENAPIDSRTENTPEQANNNTKFTVDTILGGTGKGLVDGNVSKAKISNVIDMTVDGNNNIFFIDEGSYSGSLDKSFLRKFTVDSRIVETVKIEEDMLNTVKIKSPTKVIYDNVSNSIFVLCDNAYERYLAMFQMQTDDLNSVVKIIDTLEHRGGKWFAFLVDENTIIIVNSGDFRTIYKVSKEGDIEEIENMFNNVRLLKSVASNGNDLLVVFRDYISGELKLMQSQFFPRNNVEIPLSLSIIDDVEVLFHDGSFYAMSSKGIYNIHTDGKVSVFIDFQDLIFNDGNDGMYSKFAFDSNGNVIVYDYRHGSLRKINMN